MVIRETEKVCHMCAGTGKVPTPKRFKKFPDIKIKSDCYYCKGAGFRRKDWY